jgi:hypothetical protein
MSTSEYEYLLKNRDVCKHWKIVQMSAAFANRSNKSALAFFLHRKAEMLRVMAQESVEGFYRMLDSKKQSLDFIERYDNFCKRNFGIDDADYLLSIGLIAGYNILELAGKLNCSFTTLFVFIVPFRFKASHHVTT